MRFTGKGVLAPRRAAPAAIVFGLALAVPTGCREGVEPVETGWLTVCTGAGEVAAVWANAPDDVFFVGGAPSGGALLLHYDGRRWLRTLQASDRVLRAVWGFSGNDVWAVGDEGEALHWRSGIWERTCALPAGCAEGLQVCFADSSIACASDGDCPFVPLPALYGVWGSSPDRVWAVGGSALPDGAKDVLLFWNGAQWVSGTLVDPAGAVLMGVWGAARDDVWAVGTGGTIYRFDGSVWNRVFVGIETDLTGVWGTGPADVWAVGGGSNGTILHFDGVAWGIAKPLVGDEAPPRLEAVWAPGSGAPMVVGLSGYSGRVRATGLERIETGRPGPLIGVFGDSAGSWAVGGDVVLRLGLGVAACEIEEFVQPLSPPPACGGANCEGLAGPGEECPNGRDCDCQSGLGCWWVTDLPSGGYGHFVCTEICADAGECADYGTSACCVRPGIQVLYSVCHPGGFEPTEGDPCQ